MSILIFHRVLAAPDPLFPDELTVERFDQICEWLARWFEVLPLDAAVRQLRTGTLPQRALSITFDDGYADNFGQALPILRRHGLPATFFIATGFLEGGCMWNDALIEAVRSTRLAKLDLRDADLALSEPIDVTTNAARRVAIGVLIPRIKYLPPTKRQQVVEAITAQAGTQPPSPMMNPAQVRSLNAAGMQIGAHTVSHPILARIDEGAAAHEIGHSKATLEALLDQPVTLFAYPNGKPGEDYNAHSVRLAQEVGFEAAVTTAWGAARHGDSMFEIPRFTPWDRSRWRFGLRMAANLRRNPQLAR